MEPNTISTRILNYMHYILTPPIMIVATIFSLLNVRFEFFFFLYILFRILTIFQLIWRARFEYEYREEYIDLIKEHFV